MGINGLTLEGQKACLRCLKAKGVCHLVQISRECECSFLVQLRELQKEHDERVVEYQLSQL